MPGTQRQAVAAYNPWRIKLTLGCMCTLFFTRLHSREVQRELFTVGTGADEAAALWKAAESTGASCAAFSWHYEVKAKGRLLASVPALPVK